MSYGSFSLVRTAQTIVTPAVTHSFCFVALAPVASTFLKKTATLTLDKTNTTVLDINLGLLTEKIIEGNYLWLQCADQ